MVLKPEKVLGESSGDEDAFFKGVSDPHQFLSVLTTLPSTLIGFLLEGSEFQMKSPV